MGYPKALSFETTTGWPGASPSTSTPKKICVFTERSICMRGSCDGSVESRTKMRPSSGCALRFLENETENCGPSAGAGTATRGGIAMALTTKPNASLRMFLFEMYIDVPLRRGVRAYCRSPMIIARKRITSLEGDEQEIF